MCIPLVLLRSVCGSGRLLSGLTTDWACNARKLIPVGHNHAVLKTCHTTAVGCKSHATGIQGLTEAVVMMGPVGRAGSDIWLRTSLLCTVERHI